MSRLKPWLIIMLVVMAVKRLPAQNNLVPNSGFENNAGCPQTYSQWNLCDDWYDPNQGTPDYFHTCAPPSSPAYVPDNVAGYQAAHTGSAYLGVGIFFATGSVEYIQVRLSETLVAGKTYCVEFYVSLADNSRNATMAPQMYFSDDAISGQSADPLIIAPHIADPVILNDTAGWVRISGEYRALGGEQFITIGHFSDVFSTAFVVNDPAGANRAYFYIDDVRIFQKAAAEAGSSASICRSDSIRIGAAPDTGIAYVWYPAHGLSDSTSSNPWAHPDSTTTYYVNISYTGNLYYCASTSDSITVYVTDCTPPIPLSIPTLLFGNEVFFIQALPPNSLLKVYDSRGRLVAQRENYQNDFSVSNLENAIYFYELTLPDLSVRTGKFCVMQ